MSRLRLWAAQERESPSVLFTDANGDLVRVGNWRVYCVLLVGRDHLRHEAIIDTGAPTSVFPFDVWRRFAAQIDWLSFADRSQMKSATLGGVSYHYKFGRIAVRLAASKDQEPFPSVEVIAQFEQPDADIPPSKRLSHTLVGLQFGPLEGRSLVVSPRRDHPERCEAWVTDVPQS